MKVKLLYSSAILGFGLMALASFSGGATSGAGDRTGSPLSSGTCEGCHSSPGSFSPNIVVGITDASNVPVTNNTYTPGATYTIRMSVSALPVASIPPLVAQYGAQLTALDGSNAMAGSFTNPSTGATGAGFGSKISILNGVTYLEHSQRSTDGIFNVTWTAPASGTGDVTIYAAGLAINNNSSTSGDNYVNTTVTLSESTSTSVEKVAHPVLDYSIYPNPVQDNRFFIDGINGDANIAIRDITGRVVYQVNTNIQQAQAVDLPQLPKGVYTVSIFQDNKLGSQKMILQ